MDRPVTVEAIRARYPHPVQATAPATDDPAQYCVGGAFCRYVVSDEDIGFPCAGILAATLSNSFPSLRFRDLYTTAWDIVLANDSGDFEIAWRILGEILAQQADTV